MKNDKILGIPNGSLSAPTLELLTKAGLQVGLQHRKFRAILTGLEGYAQILQMRPQDMPKALADGMIDAGICGYDSLMESGLNEELQIVRELNYSKTLRQSVRVVIIGKNAELVDTPETRVSTEYPLLARQIFKRAQIDFSYGGTEQKVAYGSYDYGICVTETGASIIQNNLRIVKTIFTSPTILLARVATPELTFLGDLLAGCLQAEDFVLLKFNISAQDKAKVLEFLPAMESPTISPLLDGAFALETLVSNTDLASTLQKIKQSGGTGIVVTRPNIILP